LGGQRQVRPFGNAITPREKTFPFITGFPQSRFHWRIDSEETWRALAILADVRREFKVDEKRLYVTGISIGGWGTFGLGMKYPDRWAATVPIAGGDDSQAAGIKDLPRWCFQGADDSEAFVKSTRAVSAAIWEAGGNPKYTVYPDSATIAGKKPTPPRNCTIGCSSKNGDNRRRPVSPRRNGGGCER
jgi:predicted peptidase